MPGGPATSAPNQSDGAVISPGIDRLQVHPSPTQRQFPLPTWQPAQQQARATGLRYKTLPQAGGKMDREGLGRLSTAQDVLAGEDLSGKTFFVSGGNSGIGCAAGRTSIWDGYRVGCKRKWPTSSLLGDHACAVSCC